MVEWLAGNRIRGTSTERTTGAGFNQVDAVSGGWKEVGRTTLGSNSQNITVSSIPDKRYYMVLGSIDLTGAGTGGGFRFGSGSVDSGSNYAYRQNANGGTDSTAVTQTRAHPVGGYSNADEFYVGYIANLSLKEKLLQMHRLYGLGGGAGNDPKRAEYASKWVNTSNPLDTLNFYQGGSDNYVSGSELVVLGWDETDTHSDNFWEPLGSTTLSTAGTNIEVTFTAKKYLMVKVFAVSAGNNADMSMQFNNDTGTNYSYRRSNNGGADGTNNNAIFIIGGFSIPSGQELFKTMIIDNQSNKEKLAIIHEVSVDGAGAGTAPLRSELVGKWANTSSQITTIDFNSSSQNYASGSFVEVWYAD